MNMGFMAAIIAANAKAMKDQRERDEKLRKLKADIEVGDDVICIASGIKGKVVKKYYPTACEQQTMIQCDDGRLYHAPTNTFIHLNSDNGT